MCRNPCMRACDRRPGASRGFVGAFLTLGAVAALLGSSGCVSQAPPGPPGQEAALAETTFSFDQKEAKFDTFRDYRIQPGDQLDVLFHVQQDLVEDEFRMGVDQEVTVRFIDIPEMNETQNVRPDGTVSLPYLGVVKVAGRTVHELEDDLKARYAALARQPFRIGVDHQLTVKFVATPELNEVQVVRPDGTVSLPYLGVVPAAGKTIEEFTAALRTAYAPVLKSPEIHVLDTEPRTVWGEVAKKLQQPNIHVVVKDFREGVVQLQNELRTNNAGLSHLSKVRPDGCATFPVIGDLAVAQKTVPEVNQVLNQKYAQVLRGLTVSLNLDEHAGSEIFVMGNVKTPGAFPIQKPMPVMKALALAGSFLPGTDVESLVVYRRHDKQVVATKIDLKSVLQMNGRAAYFYMQPDDVLYVPRSDLSLTAEKMRDVADTIFFKGWSVTPFSGHLDLGPGKTSNNQKN